MPSSKTSIDHRDIYYRLGKSAGYRARSAFKLLHLDEDFDLFSGVETAVDLCAAPGSWSQVLAEKLESGLVAGTSKVVAVDLQPMAPLHNVTTLQADITQPSTVPLVLEALGGKKADLVICDGAPDVTGVHDLDAYLHSQLILAALTLALTLLAPNGTLVFKIFVSPLDAYATMLKSQLRPFFVTPDVGEGGGFDKQGRRGGVWNRKPRSSRPGSGEQFVICRNFNSGIVPLPTTFSEEDLQRMKSQSGTLSLDFLAHLAGGVGQPSKEWEMIKGFAECGDLNAMANSDDTPDASVSQPKQLLTVDTSTGNSPIVTGATPQTAQPSSDETPTTSSSAAFLSPKKHLTLAGGDRAHLFQRNVPSHLTNISAASADITPPPSSSPMSYTHDKPWERQAPSPLPSPIILHPPGAPPDGLLALPTRQPTKSTSTPVLPSNLAKFREDDYRHSPLADDGAVSPALSTSSKTDLFFASQASELPRPPKALPNSASLGRSGSLLREDRGRASTVPSTPLGASTPYEDSSSQISASSSRNDIFGDSYNYPAESSMSALGRASSLSRDRSTGWRSISSPVHSAPTPPRGLVPRSPLASAVQAFPDVVDMREESDLPPPSASMGRRESHLEREIRQIPKEYDLVPGMVLEPIDEPHPFEANKGEPQKHDRWRLDRKLGEGAFSAVWAASAEGQLSAIKLTSQHPQSSAAESTLMRTHISFLREKSVLRRISHPNIVAFIDSFSTESHHCLVLERIGGGELFEYIADEALWKRSVTPSPEGLDGVHDRTGEGFAKRVFGELVEAVGWLHSVGVVHRDVKLENILLLMNPFTLPPTPSGSLPLLELPPPPLPLIKLTDFGLSRFINPSSPLLETRCGSESFAAPEIIMGRPYDGRATDSWACGVVLYTLLNGAMPFDGPLPSSFSAGVEAAEGRTRGSSISSIASTGSVSEEKERRRRIMRIAKGQYSWPAARRASLEAREVVGRLLVRDPKKRGSVGKEIMEMEWWKAEPAFNFHSADDRAEEGEGRLGKATRVGRGQILEGGLEEGLYGDLD